VELIWRFLVERQFIILKARQLGISWLVCGYALWLSLFRPGRNTLIFSRTLLEANDMISRIRKMFTRLPDWMRFHLPYLTVDNTQELVWSNGSRIRAMPATKGAGRSFTASLLIFDEFAFAANMETLYNAAKPTIDAGGQLIILSTANGIGNLFYDLWLRAVKKLTELQPVFLPWHARPGRTLPWYEKARAEATDPLDFQQEYPATADEAFISTERSRFLQSIGWWDGCRADLPPLDADTPLLGAADAGVSSDSFGVVFVGPGVKSGKIAVRSVMEWSPQQGEQLDYRPIRDDIAAFCSRHNVLQLTYDPYQLHSLMNDLMHDEGIWTEPFSQQNLRLVADKMLHDAIKARTLEHDGDTRLRQHIDNANRKLEGSDSLNQKLRIVKRRDDLKIDLAVCLSMAHYRAKTDIDITV
jgi:phage terminase large subunit-like protein